MGIRTVVVGMSPETTTETLLADSQSTPTAEVAAPQPVVQPELNYGATRRFAKRMLGPTARIWHRNGRVDIGTEYGSEKKVYVSESSFTAAVVALMTVMNEANTPAAPAASPGVIEGK